MVLGVEAFGRCWGLEDGALMTGINTLIKETPTELPQPLNYVHAWVLSCVLLFVTSWTLACQAPLFMGLSWQAYWNGLLFPAPGDLPSQGLNPSLLHLLHWHMDSLPLSHLGSPLYYVKTQQKDSHLWGSGHFSSVQSLSHVRLFATPWTTAHEASLSITNSRSLPKLMSVESVMPSNRLILCRPLLLPPSIFPSIRVFSNESAVCIRWPKY